jgi:hypothetical protein
LTATQPDYSGELAAEICYRDPSPVTEDSLRLLLILVAAATIAGCGGSPSGPDGVQSLIVVGTPPSVGAASQFSALAVHADGTTAPVTAPVAWRSSNAAVATVTDAGMVRGVSRGSVEISAAFGSARGALTFDVPSSLVFRLSGTVFDVLSFRRLARATVVARDAFGTSISVVTDDVGNFTIAGIAAGPADVTAHADGYITSTVSARILGDTSVSFPLGRASICPALGFDDLIPNDAPFTTWTACGLTVSATTSNWTVSGTAGRPAPFVRFISPLGVTTSAELAVTAPGPKFRFQSVDVYTTSGSIPYSITGIGNGTALFVVQGTVAGGTFTGFTTVSNTEGSDVPIDALLIRLSNSGPACCLATVNTAGLDNIVLVR